MYINKLILIQLRKVHQCSLFCSATLLFLLFAGCSKGQPKKDENIPSVPTLVNVTIDVSKNFQTIDNFGASDAWSCQFIGNWPDAKKNNIADLLFSTDLKQDGQPKGIGLSIWRFNIGAGSAQQGDQSGIKDEWRRAESFLNNDGTYDWERQKGQMWFLQAAKDRKVDQFLAFTNSPPVQITLNGKAYASSAIPNLAPEKFDAFAGFLTEVVKGVQTKTGIQFNYISPVNEPQWDWSDGGQEGSPFRNMDNAGIVKSLNAALIQKNLFSKITVTEAGQYDFLYSDNGKPGKGSQVDASFKPGSENYIGDLPSVDKLIAGHSYFTTSPFNNAVAIRKQVADKVSSINGLKFWQSEYCILGDNAGEIRGENRDLGINPALYIAKTIHNDLVTANATAWQWWLAISAYDYKDGLIYVDKSKTDGSYYASKMLWALGNYSRFIRPGSVRVAVSSVDIASNNDLLLISSYIDKAAKKLITVIVNSDINPVNLKLDVKNGLVTEVHPYITSADADLQSATTIKTTEPIIIQARTITTLVSDIQ